MTKTLRTLGLGAAFLLPATAVVGQDAGAVIDRMLEAYEGRTAGIDNYTVVQSVMGFETTAYFVKEMDGGRPVFRMANSSTGGVDVNMSDEGGGLDEIYSMGEEFKERAEYVGRESIDGFEVHVVQMDDLEGTDLGRTMSGEGEFTPVRGRLYLDTELYVPRRMVFEGELRNDEGTHSVTSTMNMTDYRDHQGMLIAHRSVMSIEGLDAAIDDEARAQFEEMERELANMPPEQRRMVESMMATQLEQFRAMMSGGGEPMVFEVEVREVRINAGPPGVR